MHVLLGSWTKSDNSSTHSVMEWIHAAEQYVGMYSSRKAHKKIVEHVHRERESTEVHISRVRCYCSVAAACAATTAAVHSFFFFYCYYIFLCLYDRMCFDKRRLVSAWKLRKIGRERSASTFRVFISWRKFIRFFVFLSFLLLSIWYNKCTPTLECETMNRERRSIGEHFM